MQSHRARAIDAVDREASPEAVMYRMIKPNVVFSVDI